MQDDRFSRIPSQAGWCSTSQLPRGPAGRALCRQCGHEVPAGRRSFCGPDCVHAWKLRTNPGYQRDQVFKRDRGVCQACGCDTVQLERAFEAAVRWAREQDRAAYGYDTIVFGYDSAVHSIQHQHDNEHAAQRLLYQEVRVTERLLVLGFLPHRSFWDMDHVVPVVEGGGGCDLVNLRTLCRPCHLAVTRQLRARRAKGARA